MDRTVAQQRRNLLKGKHGRSADKEYKNDDNYIDNDKDLDQNKGETSSETNSENTSDELIKLTNINKINFGIKHVQYLGGP